MWAGGPGADIPSRDARRRVTFGRVALALGGVAVFAAYLPARRAVRVDPVISLKSE